MVHGLEASSLAGVGFVFSNKGEGHADSGFVSLGWAPGRALLARITDKVADLISLQSPVGVNALGLPCLRHGTYLSPGARTLPTLTTLWSWRGLTMGADRGYDTHPVYRCMSRVWGW